MSTPSQLDEGGRKIPLTERSRRSIGDCLYLMLAAIRRTEGVAPERYPPVKFDIQYDITRTLAGAEMAARETADILLPAILHGISPGRFRKFSAVLRHPLLAAAIVLAAVIPTYLEVVNLKKSAFQSRDREQAVGRAILINPSIVTTIGDHQITLTVNGDVTTDGKSTVLKLDHALPPKVLNAIK